MNAGNLTVTSPQQTRRHALEALVSASTLWFTAAFSGITTRKMIDPNQPLRLLPELENALLAPRNKTAQRSGIRMRDGYGVKSSAGTILSNGMFAVSFSFLT